MREVYKIMNGREKVIREVLFIPSRSTGTGHHPMKSMGSRFNTNIRQYLFTQHKNLKPVAKECCEV